MLVDPKLSNKLLWTNPKPEKEMLEPQTEPMVGKPQTRGPRRRVVGRGGASQAAKEMLVDSKPAKRLLLTNPPPSKEMLKP